MRFSSRLSRYNLAFALRDPGERLVPACLQFASHQAVGRVAALYCRKARSAA